MTQETTMAKNVAIKHEPEITQIDEVTSVLQIIERMAVNPAVDVTRLERLLDMHDRIIARRAKGAYLSALSEMQDELPIIEKRGRIEVRAKDSRGERTGNITQSTAYARWEDINEEIKPVLRKWGFALSFRTALTADGRINVTGILSHKDGHSEETSLPLPYDTTGSKNNVQAVGSSVSYGKRYTAAALLNITARGEDDDGKAAGAEATISEEQLADLLAKLETDKADLGKFEGYLKVEKLSDLPASRFQEALEAMAARKAAVAKAKAKVKA